MATPLKRKIGYVKAEKPVKPVEPVKKARKSRTKLYENARNRTIYMPEDFWSEITPEKTGMTRNSFLVAAGRAKLAEMGIA